jgi:uncharacterized membrane protein YphA (DoxX/SURF4 family)
MFLLSGAGKVVDVAAFGQLITQYGLGRLQILAPLIVLAEILLGGFLILRIYPKVTSLLAAILLLIFTAAFTYAHSKHGVDDCGCFGVIKIGKNSVLFTYVRNFLLLGLSLFVWRTSPQNENAGKWKKQIVLGAMLPFIFVAGLTFQLPVSSRQAKNHLFLDKNIRETALSQYVSTVPQKSYLIFMFSYNCPHCWNSIENYKHFKESGIVDSLIAFAIVNGDTANSSNSRKIFAENFGDLAAQEIVHSDNLQTFIKGVPTSFFVANDTVKAAIEHELPSTFTFRDAYHPVLTSPLHHLGSP